MVLGNITPPCSSVLHKCFFLFSCKSFVLLLFSLLMLRLSDLPNMFYIFKSKVKATKRILLFLVTRGIILNVVNYSYHSSFLICTLSSLYLILSCLYLTLSCLCLILSCLYLILSCLYLTLSCLYLVYTKHEAKAT